MPISLTAEAAILIVLYHNIQQTELSKNLTF